MTYSPVNIRLEGIRVLRSSNIDEDTFTFGEDDVFVDKGVVKSPLVKEGDILITAANGSSRLVGKHTIIKDLPENSAIHGGFMLLASCRNPEFINSLMSSAWYTKFINLYVAGGNGAIGNLNKHDLDEQNVLVPSQKEQSAIGTFFSTLDQQITLHQRKLDKLKSVKQAYLSEMFPAEGERVPKRRFPGFTDDWELRKLVNEVLFVGTGKSKFSALEFGEFEILGSTSVIGYDNSYDYEGDFILTARVGANAGELYRHSGKVKISDNTVFIQGDGLDFIFYILQHFDIKKLSFGTGQPLVKASELKELKILMPVSVKERNHVGTFFSTLDRHITLHQRKSI